MLETPLRTKLFIPPLRPNLVERSRLVERLHDGIQLGHKLTLISAPAGFGKTTLASEWIHSLQTDGAVECDHQIAWLSLDEDDSNPTRFLVYFITALNQAEGEDVAFGESMLSMLDSPQSPPVEDVLVALINGISTVAHRVVVVLDDYHLIDSTPVDDTLTFLLDYQPPQMHLVIVTRSDPDLPLARLRAHGQLTELRAADLRFTSAETAAFLNKVMDLNLSAGDIAALESRTEGWIAGLQLTAISMKGRDDAATFIESFTGSHHFIVEYLLEDVLNQQPQRVQEFLLRTAILKRLNGALCDALTGLENGHSILENLVRDNLFIMRLDEQRHWYRYHQFFADVLRERLHYTRPDEEIMLHLRASNWYEQNGFTDEAIEHALHAADHERTADLLEEHIEALWGQGEHSKLQRWLNALPEAFMYSKPIVSIFQARYQCNSGQLDAAERTLEAAEAALDANHAPGPGSGAEMGIVLRHSDEVKLRGRVAATRAIMCSYQGDVAGIIARARQALSFLPEEDVTWRSVTAIVLGNAYGFKGDMQAAYEARFEAMKACQAAGDIYFVMISNLELAITLREQGHLQRTIGLCRQQLQFAADRGLSQSRAVGWLLAIWGETLAELGELDAALKKAKKGFEQTLRSGDFQLIGWSFMCLTRVLVSRGDLAEAQELIRRMERFAQEASLPPWITSQMSVWQVRIWLAQEDMTAIAQWIARSRLPTGNETIPPQEIGFFLLFDYIVLARVLASLAQLEESSELLRHLLAAAEVAHRTSSAIEILVLQALTLRAKGEPKEALSALELGLVLAEPLGFVRIFVDEGPAMAQLLCEALDENIAPQYVRHLLAAFDMDESPPVEDTRPVPDQSELIEPLSERELEIVQLIADGLANRQIAARLFLSLNTVKVHTRNIYGKLGVHSRTQAVAEARTLGLISSDLN